jgi:hypothetical protein
MLPNNLARVASLLRDYRLELQSQHESDLQIVSGLVRALTDKRGRIAPEIEKLKVLLKQLLKD